MTKQKKVLIIDDEVELCELLKMYFQKRQYDVLISNTIKDSRFDFQHFSPDIAFIDNNLPDGSGWELAVEISRSNPEIFIVLISGFYPDLPKMPLNANYTVIEKPVSFSDIENKIQNHANAK